MVINIQTLRIKATRALIVTKLRFTAAFRQRMSKANAHVKSRAPLWRAGKHGEAEALPCTGRLPQSLLPVDSVRLGDACVAKGQRLGQFFEIFDDTFVKIMSERRSAPWKEHAGRSLAIASYVHGLQKMGWLAGP